MGEIFGLVYEAGDPIFRQGEVGQCMYIIQSGAVEVRRTQDGQEHVLTVLQKGDFFGEMSLLAEEPRTATVVASCQTRLLPLTHDSLIAKIQQDPGVMRHLLKGLMAKLQTTNRLIMQAVEATDADSDCGAEPDGPVTPAEPDAAAATIPVAPPAEAAIHAAMPADELPGPVDPGSMLAEIWRIQEDMQTFAPDELIFRQGDPGDTMYVIAEGRVEIAEDSGHVLGHLGPGEFFGEMALVTDMPRLASARVLEPTRLLCIGQELFFTRITEHPELAMHILMALISRLRWQNEILANPEKALEAAQKSWRPLLRKEQPVRIAIVSLSTCAGCSAILLDQEVLTTLMERAEIVYCPMLLDQQDIPEVDVALVDGIVRLHEDEEKLHEARRKSRYLVSWGTCAALGGIPANANAYEVEELIDATYGRTGDAFTYYLSGRSGIDSSRTFQDHGMDLMRRAYRVNDFVKVDYYVPGCPPEAAFLLQMLDELQGRKSPAPRPVVCAECNRRPAKVGVESLQALPENDCASTCFNSLGAVCLGFLIRGGCGGMCPQHGLPCWGCRGPSASTLKSTGAGDSFEEVVIAGLSRRCRMEESKVKSFVKALRQRGHGLFNLDTNSVPANARVR